MQGFGEQPTIKSQALNLVRSIRTVMRSESVVIRKISFICLSVKYIIYNLNLIYAINSFILTYKCMFVIRTSFNIMQI